MKRPKVTTADAKKPTSTHRRRVEEVWTSEIVKARGHTAVANLFLDCYAALGLNQTEAMFLIHLIRHKWSDDDKPFPKYRTLAQRLGLHDRRVRKVAKDLEDKGFLVRIERRRPGAKSDSNKFDLAPLMHKLKKYAKTELKDGEAEA